MTKKSWKRLIELTIAVLSVIASFLGGQAAAQNGYLDLFNTQNERSI
jgi:hypothetical protein